MFDRILVPTDFSTASRPALEYAIDLATRYGATINLLHVVEEPVYGIAYPEGYIAGVPLLHQQMREDAERLLATMAQTCKAANVTYTTGVIVGRPATMIVEQSERQGADLIVMGTHGHSGFAHLLLGSVAERVLRSARCPVLTVRDVDRPAGATS